MDDFRGVVLAEVLAAGTQLYDEIREAKGQPMERMIKTVRQDEALRHTDPWQNGRPQQKNKTGAQPMLALRVGGG